MKTLLFIAEILLFFIFFHAKGNFLGGTISSYFHNNVAVSRHVYICCKWFAKFLSLISYSDVMILKSFSLLRCILCRSMLISILRFNIFSKRFSAIKKLNGRILLRFFLFNKKWILKHIYLTGFEYNFFCWYFNIFR